MFGGKAMQFINTSSRHCAKISFIMTTQHHQEQSLWRNLSGSYIVLILGGKITGFQMLHAISSEDAM